MRQKTAFGPSSSWYGNYGGLFDFARITAELAHMEHQMAHPEFWTDAQDAAKIGLKKAELERDLQQWRDIDGKMNDLGALLELTEESNDPGLVQELTVELNYFEPK